MTPELVQPGLWRIPMKMRTVPPYVNLYLVRSGEGWLLIDSGPPGEGSWDELAEALSGCGVAPEGIHSIVLTHAHPDHTGQAVALRERTGAPVWLHPADAAMLQEIVERPPGIREVLQLSGTPEEMWADVEAAHERLTGHFHRVPGTLPLDAESVFETGIGKLRAIHTPGHSPGHCCLVTEGIAFSGDHVLPDVLPHAGFIPGHDTLGDYLGTIPGLKELDVRLVLPSHGLPFDGWRAWLERAEATHTRRLARVAALRAAGRSPHEMVGTMWPRELRPVDYQLALTRVLGYLAHLDQGTTGPPDA